MDNHVGIWKKDMDGSYTRDPVYKEDYNWWADVEKIPFKSNKKRLVFLGESVARGYLFDPALNPAMILQHLFNQHNDRLDDWEVIDLARTSILIRDLELLCRQCAGLEPDALVIFAGNNWMKDFDHCDESVYGKVMEVQKNRLEHIRKVLETLLETEVAHFMDTLKTIVAALGNIPVLFLIPGTNLVDWSYSLEQSYFPFPEKALECVILKEEIEQALSVGQFASAEKKTNRLIEIAPYSVAAYELKAKAIQPADYDKSVEYFQKAHDAKIYTKGYTPGCFLFTRMLLKHTTEEYGFKYIDLQENFRKDFPVDYAGKKLYVDYCHLSYIGMHYAMYYVYQKVLEMSSNVGQLAIPVELSYVPIKNKSLSSAHFFAAVCSAHLGQQSYDNYYYQCSQAVQASTDGVNLMRAYAKIASSQPTWHLNKEYSALIENSRQFYIYEKKCFKIIDIDLVDAIVNVLEQHGVPCSRVIRELRLAQFGPYPDRPVDLLQPRWLNDTYYLYFLLRHLSNYADECTAYFRLVDCRTTFRFFADINNDLEFKSTLRLSQGILAESISIKCNGNSITDIPINNNWNDISFVVPKSILNKSVVQEITLTVNSAKMEDNWSYELFENNSIAFLHSYKPAYVDILLFNFLIRNM